MTADGPVVTDTGPLIHLGEADALRLLEQFDPLLLPETVLDELRVGDVPDGFETLEYERRSVSVSDDTRSTLDPGETSAIALCRRIDGMLLTDDLDARQEATDLGIEVHGSIGVVLTAYAAERIDAERARTVVRNLERDSTLYLTGALVDRAIDRIDDREDDLAGP